MVAKFSSYHYSTASGNACTEASGKARIDDTGWGKILVISAMLLSQVILAASMMPTSVYRAVQDVFIGTDTHPVTQVDPSAPLDVDHIQ
jgi:hypothetical protein